MAKPNINTDWNTSSNTNKVEPSPGAKSTGIQQGGTWARQWLNWMFYGINQWINWVRDDAMDRTENLNDLADKAVARGNLGVQTAAEADAKYVPLSGDATVGGNKTFSEDLTVNSITVGQGQKTSALVTSNTSVGADSLTLNTTGDRNTAIGKSTMVLNTSGDNNTAVGSNALSANTTGFANTAIGRAALIATSTGSNNVAIGYSSAPSMTSGTNNILIGNSSGSFNSPFEVTTQSNRVVIGDNNITNAYIRVAWTVTSDKRDKTNISELGHGLGFINNLNPVKYEFKKGGRDSDTGDGVIRYGFLAQEILAIEGDDPVIVDNEQEDSLKLKESNLIPVLVNAIQELSEEVEKLKASNAS